MTMSNYFWGVRLGDLIFIHCECGVRSERRQGNSFDFRTVVNKSVRWIINEWGSHPRCYNQYNGKRSCVTKFVKISTVKAATKLSENKKNSSKYWKKVQITQLPRGGGEGGGTPNFRWRGWLNGGKNQNPKKSLGLPTKPQKPLDEKLPPPKKIHAKLLSLKNFQKALNDRDTQAPPRIFRLKFFYPQKTRNQKFQTQKNSLIIRVSWNPEYPPRSTAIQKEERMDRL